MPWVKAHYRRGPNDPPPDARSGVGCLLFFVVALGLVLASQMVAPLQNTPSAPVYEVLSKPTGTARANAPAHHHHHPDAGRHHRPTRAP